MAVSFVITTVKRTALANALNDDLDGGKLRIYSGASPGPNSAATGDLLADFTLPAKATNTVANGVLTFGAIANVNAAISGTAGYFRFLKSDLTVIADGNVALSAATLNLSSLALVSGNPVSITAFTITVPAGT